MTVERKHIYKVFNNGTYLGLMPNVTSDFEYTQEINSSSTDMQIEVALNIDTSMEAVENITDELGNAITTEVGENITTERSIELIGEEGSGAFIADNNDIEVWEISDYYPSGVLVFSGYISRWDSSLSADSTDITTVNLISYGKDLSDYIIGTGTYNLETSQTSFNVDSGMHRIDQPSSQIPFYAQTLSGLSYTLSKISLLLALGNVDGGLVPVTAIVTVKLYSGTPGAASVLLGTMTAVVTNTAPSFQYVDFILPDTVALSSATSYWFSVQANDYVEIRLNDPGSHPNGPAYLSNDLVTWFLDTSDLAYKLYSGGTATDAVFVAQDPSTILTTSLDLYIGQGGNAGYSVATIDTTGLSLDYTFKLATMLDIVRKVLELAPSGWYWYVDPATQLLYFKDTLANATHQFKLGRHIQNMQLGGSVEEIVNVVYFSGGPTAGVNLLKRYTNQDSLADNRRGLQLLNDNRVTEEATAQALADTLMDSNADETFQVTVEISANTYDIDSIALGATVSISGFSSFVDRLILQITKFTRKADSIQLTLGRLPFRPDSYVDQIRRDVENEQTLANPSAPS